MLKKTISRTVIIDKERNCLRLAGGNDHGGFWSIDDLEFDVTGKLPDCNRYRVDYTLNPNGKFMIVNKHFIVKAGNYGFVSSHPRNVCFTEPYGWNNQRFNRVVRVLE